ncbi:protein SRC2 homolog isoform X1 [Cynara cardunculus var. scolymus]|uniref:protein SRC2 homolog isoform X1 n=2 Tax=Cynara cardunculus var. scolymus TaxID=59895 RepID=UPI000D62D548|nr:protein SRC2 homolog isoform X1 [Cynara cardunculus var. scolymus]
MSFPMNNQPSIPPATYHHHHPMANHGIHGNLLEVTVVCCNKLKDTEWLSRQDPYVCVEYGSNRYRTRVCTDGGKNPTFQEKFVFSLIEGLRELNVVVWNSNTISHDDFIGSGKVQLATVLSHGYDDTAWPLQTKTGRHAGELRLIMHYSSANKPANSYAPSAPPYVASSSPQVSMYSAPLPPSSTSYPPQASGAPYPPAGAYPAPSPYPSYPPNTGAYAPSSYPPQTAPYPSQPYPPDSAYPPQPYPPNSAYPPQPYGSHYPAGSSHQGGYPPPY